MSGSASAARAIFAGAFAMMCATLTACGGSGPGPMPRPEMLYASWSIEEVEITRGEVRIGGAVEVDPEARELEIVGGGCPTRSLGGGLWTRNRLVWRLSADDVGAALGCSSRLGVQAKRWPTSLARVSSHIDMRLNWVVATPDDTNLAAITHLDVAFDGDESIVRVRTTGGRGLVMSASATTSGPIDADEESATFRVPTASLVTAALRKHSIRFSAGPTEAHAYVSLYIDNQLVTTKETVEDQSVESSESESESEDRG